MKPFEEDQARIKSLEEQLELANLTIHAMHLTLIETISDYEARYLINRDKLENY